MPRLALVGGAIGFVLSVAPAHGDPASRIPPKGVGVTQSTREAIAAQAIVAPLSQAQILTAARERGSVATTVKETLRFGVVLPEPEGASMTLRRPASVGAGVADFGDPALSPGNPKQAISLILGDLQPHTDYLLDCRFWTDRHPAIILDYKAYDDAGELHPTSSDTTHAGHLSELIVTRGMANGVSVSLSMDHLNVDFMTFEGCELSLLGQ